MLVILLGLVVIVVVLMLCLILYVLYLLELEIDLDDVLWSWLVFGVEKVCEVVVFVCVLCDGYDVVVDEIVLFCVVIVFCKCDLWLYNG